MTVPIRGTFDTREDAMTAAEVRGMLVLQAACLELTLSAKKRLDLTSAGG